MTQTLTVLSPLLSDRVSSAKMILSQLEQKNSPAFKFLGGPENKLTQTPNAPIPEPMTQMMNMKVRIGS